MCYCGIHECYLWDWDAVRVLGARAFSWVLGTGGFFLGRGGLFVHLYDSICVLEKLESERENVLWFLCAGGLRSLGAESGAML